MKSRSGWIYLLLTCGLLMTGCSGTKTETEGTDEPAVTQEVFETLALPEAESAENITVMGMLEYIEDDASAITISYMPRSEIPNESAGEPGEEREAPAGEPGGEREAPAGEPGGEREVLAGEPGGEREAPAGEPGGEREVPAGEPGGERETLAGEPGQNADAPQNPENTETMIITLTDDTVMKDENGNEITLADLSEGIMITVETDADNQALTIQKN